MKRFLIGIAVLVFLGMITVSCNNYVCPAYAQDNPQPEVDINTDC